MAIQLWDGTDVAPARISWRRGPDVGTDEVIVAYEERCDFAGSCSGAIVLTASLALADCAKGPEDCARVYSHLLERSLERHGR